jgi:hypothetical protein
MKALAGPMHHQSASNRRGGSADKIKESANKDDLSDGDNDR